MVCDWAGSAAASAIAQAPASVAVRKFARILGLLRSELPNQSDPSNVMILVSLLDPKFANVVAGQSCELRVRDTVVFSVVKGASRRQDRCSIGCHGLEGNSLPPSEIDHAGPCHARPDGLYLRNPSQEIAHVRVQEVAFDSGAGRGAVR